jgi:hypothetical protein
VEQSLKSLFWSKFMLFAPAENFLSISFASERLAGERLTLDAREQSLFFDLVNGLGAVLFYNSEQYFRFFQFAAYDELAVESVSWVLEEHSLFYDCVLPTRWFARSQKPIVVFEREFD